MTSVVSSTGTMDFYPRSPCGERRPRQVLIIAIDNFYPRSPCGERPSRAESIAAEVGFLSTLSLRRATPATSRNNKNNVISIHALLAESDCQWYSVGYFGRYFYPRSPCGERQHAYNLVLWVLRFLSTLSLRRATKLKTPCVRLSIISIHALLAESDGRHSVHCQSMQGFLSTLSLRRATQPRKTDVPGAIEFLSTLSLRRATGGGHISKARSKNFYPRSPCGERRDVIAAITEAQSISIHALLAESDQYACKGV